MHEVLVNRLGGLSLPSNSVATFTCRPDNNNSVMVVILNRHIKMMKAENDYFAILFEVTPH